MLLTLINSYLILPAATLFVRLITCREAGTSDTEAIVTSIIA